MSAYIIAPCQAAFLATNLVRNRQDSLNIFLEVVKGRVQRGEILTVDEKIVTDFKKLPEAPNEDDLIEFMIRLIANANMESIIYRYSPDVAIEMLCNDDIENIRAEQGQIEPSTALEQYISKAQALVNNAAMTALIETTSIHQYFMWLANFRYQAGERNDFDETLAGGLLQIELFRVDLDRPIYDSCEWSLDDLPEIH